MTDRDGAALKAAEREYWGQVAGGWRKWWSTFEDGAQAVSERMVDLARIGVGDRVLDLAAGLGEPAVAAAMRAGPTGRIIATDIAPEMVALGQARVAELGLAQLEIRVMDAEAPDLPDASLDAVLCRFGLMFMPDVGAALGSAHRLLVTGGRIAVAVWSTAEKVPFLAIASAAARRTLDLPPPAPDALGPFRLADVGALEAELRRAGFVDVRHERVTVTIRFASADAFVEFVQDMSRTVRGLVEGQPPERQAQVWQAIREAAAGYPGPEGDIRLDNEAICVSGRR